MSSLKHENAFENFLGDSSISRSDDDQLQRYPFASRIAHVIGERSTSECLVIGLYGAWGEGKTSVLNFIQSDLKKKYPDILQITFNPWIYTDEQSLLTSFFNKLANEVKNITTGKKGNQNSKNPLKNKTEKFGDFIKEYSGLLSLVGANEAGETVAKSLSNVSIETLKERIEKLLQEIGKKIVVFIDDIDRLDKNELFSIFKLVKLTADFPNTVYLLSFDEHMVAEAIGERFGTSGKSAGYKFLEKIIQVPVHLPRATSSALKEYCFGLLDKVLNSTGVKLSDEDKQEFISLFDKGLANRLTTPRMAIRYVNTLAFSLPLLNGEVNLADLMLIEGIKVLYSEVYNFIRSNQNYFLRGKKATNQKNEDDPIRTELYKLCSSYTSEEVRSLENILAHLFPKIILSVGHTINYRSINDDSNYNKKRISSPYYFQRYFSYAVIKGEMSDVAFNDFLNLAKLNSPDLEKIFLRLFNSVTPFEFIEKFRKAEDHYDSQVAIALCNVFSKNASLFSKEHSWATLSSPFRQVAKFVSTLIEEKVADDSKSEVLCDLISKIAPLEFANDLYYNCARFQKGTIYFNDEQLKEISLCFVTRVLNISKSEPFFVTFSGQIGEQVISAWSRFLDKNDLLKYIETHLNKCNYLISLLKCYAPYTRSTAVPEPYFGDLTQDRYKLMKESLDVAVIYSKILECSKKQVPIQEFRTLEYEQTDENMMKQFLYLHNHYNENY